MPDLDILHLQLLRGPNVWANYPVLEAWVDLGNLNDASSDEVPGFNERLKAWLPGLIEHRCSVGERGGFLQRLDRGTYPAHILEHVTLELQTLAGHSLGFGKARATETDRVYKVVMRYLDETLVVACLRTARDLLLAAYHGQDFDVAAEVVKLRGLANHIALGPSTMAIVDAARDRAIPWRRIEQGRSLVQFGHGIRQRRIWTAETDRSGAISEYIAQDKDLTRMLLRQAGVPVPVGYKVSDPDDAWDTAESIGTPVVVKPLNANHGRGVFIDLTTEEQVKNSFQHALAEGDGVIVEHYVPGTDHRLLVVGNEMIAASKGYPAVVVGDGSRTIGDLVIAQLLTSLQTGDTGECPWSKIEPETWDALVKHDLEDQGHTLDAVPRYGERVMVARFSHWCIDVTDDVHPSIKNHAVTAAKVAGLDICGVDVVCRNIAEPLEDQDGVIVEINASPNLLMFLRPAVGVIRPVGEAIIEMLFPDGADGRIPTIGVTGTHGKTTCIRWLAKLLEQTGQCLGVSSSDGLRIGSRHSAVPVGDRIAGAHGALLHPWTEIAICEAGAQHILSDGLGFDRCSVGVVLNVGDDHLGHAHTDSMEQMAVAKRCIVDVVLPGGTTVLNADDPLVAEMGDACKGKVIYFTTRPENPAVVAHVVGGGKAVWLADGEIVLAEGELRHKVAGLAELQQPGGGEIHPENILAATGAAWAHGLTATQISSALRSDPAANKDI